MTKTEDLYLVSRHPGPMIFPSPAGPVVVSPGESQIRSDRLEPVRSAVEAAGIQIRRGA